MFADHSKLLSDPSQPQGVSAVKALAIAASQGQKIYTLTPANQAIHSSVVSGLQISANVKNEITNALSAGKEVTVHEKDITVNGWTGCGYTILDQDTGAGAYKIAGGANGGFLQLVIAIALIVILTYTAILLAPTLLGAAIAGGLGLWSYIGILKGLRKVTNDTEFNQLLASKVLGALAGTLFAWLSALSLGYIVEFAGVSIVKVISWLSAGLSYVLSWLGP